MKKLLIIGYVVSVLAMTLLFSPYTIKMTLNNGDSLNLGELKFQSYFSDGYVVEDDGKVFEVYLFDFERYKIQVGLISLIFAGIYIVTKEKSL